MRQFAFLSKPVFAVSFLLGVMGLNCLLSMSVKSPTVDEFAHLPAGYYYWKTGDFSLYAKNPPLIRLFCALPLLAMNVSMDLARTYPESGDWRPWVFGTRFMRDNADTYDRIFFAGRVPAILLALLLGWYVFRWANECYGFRGGLLSLLLYCFSPNMLAHARLVTTDVGCACFMFMAVYYYWKSFEDRARGPTLGAGVCTGLAWLTKFTSLLLLPIFALLLVLEAWAGKGAQKPGTHSAVKRIHPVFVGHLCDGVGRLLVIVMVGLLIANVGYGFKGSFKSLRATPTESTLFNKVGRGLLGRVPVPLPAAYVQGLDQQQLDAERGEFLSYLRGRLSSKGWWYYFLYAFMVKTPIALHLLILISIWLSVKHRRMTSADAFLIVPILAVFIVFSFFNRLDIGLRYVLPAFPFLFVWLGRIDVRKPLLNWGTAVIVLGYALSSVSVFPDYLAYFNAWAGGPSNGHRHLLDSNLDWGQDLKRLKTYMDGVGIKEVGLAYFGHVDPEIYGIHYHLIGERPESGDIAVSANYLYGLPYVITYGDRPVPVRPGAFQWLRACNPRADIGHSILVYSIARAEN